MKIMQSAGNTSTMPPPTDCVTHHEFPSELISTLNRTYKMFGKVLKPLNFFFNNACEVHAHSVRTQCKQHVLPYNTKAALIRAQQNIRNPASCPLSQSSIPQSFGPGCGCACALTMAGLFLFLFLKKRSTATQN